MQHCAQCDRDILTTHDLSQCYHCHKQLCPSCERNCANVFICQQCTTLRWQGKEALIHALVNQLSQWGFQLVENEVDALSLRRYTTYQHGQEGLSVTITEALNE
jgi:hypothetical protein